MSLEQKLREMHGAQLDTVDDVEELVLDELTQIDKISEKDKTFLEKFNNLNMLAMNLLGLNTLENLPNIPSITKVFF